MKNHKGRMLLGVAGLAGSLALGNVVAGSSFAHVSACRTDPIVKLSNGNSVSLSAMVFGSDTDVSQITYTLHVPVGVAVTGETFTGGAFIGKESIVVYADGAVNSYTSSYLVGDTYSNINVTGTTTLSSGKKGSSSNSLTGLTNQTLTVSVAG